MTGSSVTWSLVAFGAYLGSAAHTLRADSIIAAGLFLVGLVASVGAGFTMEKARTQ